MPARPASGLGEKREQFPELFLTWPAAVLADLEGFGVLDRGALFRAVPFGQRFPEAVGGSGLAALAPLTKPLTAGDRIVGVVCVGATARSAAVANGAERAESVAPGKFIPTFAVK